MSYADATTLPILCLDVLAQMHSVEQYIEGKIVWKMLYIAISVAPFQSLVKVC